MMTDTPLPDALALRLHRAQSWLDKAAQAEDDDTRFLALWIAFNAAYAHELPGQHAMDKSDFVRFLGKVCTLDKAQEIYELIWRRFPDSIRLLLNNHYVFQPFWDFHNGLISERAWQEDFGRAKRKANRALAAQDTNAILLVVFERIYTLRNQIVHGGASFNSSANRAQLRDACAILSALIPHIVQIMQSHPHINWGKPFYPFIAEE